MAKAVPGSLRQFFACQFCVLAVMHVDWASYCTPPGRAKHVRSQSSCHRVPLKSVNVPSLRHQDLCVARVIHSASPHPAAGSPHALIALERRPDFVPLKPVTAPPRVTCILCVLQAPTLGVERRFSAPENAPFPFRENPPESAGNRLGRKKPPRQIFPT